MLMLMCFWGQGYVVVVKGARRSGVREENRERGEKGKQGFVGVRVGDVCVSFSSSFCFLVGELEGSEHELMGIEVL